MAIRKAYKLSWVDRFLSWLRRLPIPIWVSFALLYFVATLLFHIAWWLDGAAPFGVTNGSLLFNGLWSIIGPVFLYYLARIADQALNRFAVLVPTKKREIEELRRQMTTVSQGLAFWSVALMAVVIGAGVYFDPSFMYVGLKNPISYALVLGLAIFSYAFAPILIVQGIRLLRAVVKAYELVGEVNIFHLQPLYAFSGLTMTASLFWLLIFNMNIFGNFVLAQSSGVDLVLSIVFNAPLVVLAFITFLYPLWGIHGRILRKKERALEENGLQIEKVHQKLYGHLAKSKYKDAGDLDKALSSLYKVREQIEKVPTWPWRPGSLRNFLSAVFLPLALWLLQQYLRSLLGL